MSDVSVRPQKCQVFLRGDIDIWHFISPYISLLFFTFCPGVNTAVDAAHTSNYSPVMYTSTLTALTIPSTSQQFKQLRTKPKPSKKKLRNWQRKPTSKDVGYQFQLSLLIFILQHQWSQQTRIPVFCYILTSWLMLIKSLILSDVNIVSTRLIKPTQKAWWCPS